MCKTIEISLDDMRGHLTDPPIVDWLSVEPDTGSFTLLIIPDDDMASCAKLPVQVDRRGVEGRQIAALLDNIGKTLGGHEVQRLSHVGGGNYSFHFHDGSHIELSDSKVSSADTLEVVDRLKAIAMRGVIAARIAQITAA